MGQKVNPAGLRLGINKDWTAKWYAPSKDFSATLENDMKIRNFLSKKLKNAAVSSVTIERSNKKTEIKISTAKPGVVIGHGGEEIEKLKYENAMLKKKLEKSMKANGQLRESLKISNEKYHAVQHDYECLLGDYQKAGEMKLIRL